MTISAINAYSTVAPTQAYTEQTQHSEKQETPSREESDAVSVSVSKTAQRAASMISDLPPLILDPQVHMKNAQSRLKEVMQELGIPADTQLDITVNNDGRITVEGDDDRLDKLEEMLNTGEELDLRNSLIGAQTGFVVQRIASIVDKAAQAADQNPKMTDMLFDWALGEANKAKAGRLELSYEDGTLSGGLRKADGTAFIPVDELTLPA